MNEPAIVVLFFGVLAGLIAGCATCDRKPARITLGMIALAWSGLMFLADHTVQTFNLNAWYGGAASRLLVETIKALEEGRREEVVATLKQMRSTLEVTYENHGNFKDLAEKATSGLEQKLVERIPTADGDRPPNRAQSN